jgi:glycerol kinase
MRVLAIDQGTSATKAVVVDSDGTTGPVVEVPIDVHAGPDGSVEVDPEELWSSVIVAGTRALAAAGWRIDAIGLANQGETVLAWDRASGEPCSAGIVWQDRRSASLCEQLAARGWRERLVAITGLELDPYFSAPKMAWLRSRVGPGPVITTSDTWLLQRLCGAFVTDAATASRSLLLDLESGRWNAEACGAFGIDVEGLPHVVANATMIGEARVFGERAIPVTGACVDQQAALFAESCFDAGQAKCTYGTGAFLLASTGSTPTRSANGLVGCIAWQLGDATTWCLDGQVYTAGSAVSWLQDAGLITDPKDLDRLGGSVDGPGSAVFVPGLAGLAAPFWKPSAKAAFTGLSLATTRGHLVRAVIEGVAASVALLARAAGADLGRPLNRLRVDGGLTRSRTMLQVQADLLQAPVDVYPSPHATALGVAAFARMGATGTLSAADAVGPWEPVATVEPSISADQAGDRLNRFREAAEATMDLR